MKKVLQPRGLFRLSESFSVTVYHMNYAKQKAVQAYADSKGPDQSVYLYSLIKDLCCLWVADWYTILLKLSKGWRSHHLLMAGSFLSHLNNFKVFICSTLLILLPCRDGLT